MQFSARLVRAAAALSLLLAVCDRPDADRQKPTPATHDARAGVGSTAERYSGVPVALDDSTLRFPSGATWIPGLYRLEYVGQVPAQVKAPYLLIAGYECTACDVTISLLFRSPSDGRVQRRNGYTFAARLCGRKEQPDARCGRAARQFAR
jgi:hypothetical protein